MTLQVLYSSTAASLPAGVAKMGALGATPPQAQFSKKWVHC